MITLTTKQAEGLFKKTNAKFLATKIKKEMTAVAPKKKVAKKAVKKVAKKKVSKK